MSNREVTLAKKKSKGYELSSKKYIIHENNGKNPFYQIGYFFEKN